MKDTARSKAILLLILLAALAQQARAAEWVMIETPAGQVLRAQVHSPEGKGPFPAIVALHGCAGMTSNGKLNARDQDWARRFRSAGFVVVLPDSFGSRGLGSQCATRNRSITQSGRVADAFAAAEWLSRQPMVDKPRIGLIGWSNGGTTALLVAQRGGPFRQVVAFYPGCRTIGGGFAVPTTILHGLADDWTPAEPCKALSGARFIGYPDAHHDFDHPSMTLRTREAAFTAAGGPGTVTMGTHGPSRARAIGTVMDLFRSM